MTVATLFKSNQSQAVRLPKAVAFPEDVKKVEVLVLGRARLLVPEVDVWDSWFDQPALEDFPEREVLLAQKREEL